MSCMAQRQGNPAGTRRPLRPALNLHKYHIPIALSAIVLAFAIVHGGRVRENLTATHWEDIAFMRHNASNVHSLRECFTERPLWPGLYRPLTTNLYYYVGRVAFGNRIEVYHGINVCLYLANALLLYFVCVRLLPRWWALIPPVLLVSRISHVEVILNTCEIQTLLSVFMGLAAFALFIAARRGRGRVLYALSLAAYCLALLAKETALMFPALLAAYGVLYDSRSAWRHYLPPVVLTLAWPVFYLALFRAVSDYEPTGFTYRFDPAQLLTGYAAYVLSFINLLTHRLENLAMVPNVADLAATTAARAALAVSVVACAAGYSLRRRYPALLKHGAKAVTFGFAFFLIAVSPYVILQSRLFMRYGYAGHAGLAICLAAVLYCAADGIAGHLVKKPGKEGQDAWTPEP